jgi:hypothetical protein
MSQEAKNDVKSKSIAKLNNRLQSVMPNLSVEAAWGGAVHVLPLQIVVPVHRLRSLINRKLSPEDFLSRIEGFKTECPQSRDA